MHGKCLILTTAVFWQWYMNAQINCSAHSNTESSTGIHNTTTRFLQELQRYFHQTEHGVIKTKCNDWLTDELQHHTPGDEPAKLGIFKKPPSLNKEWAHWCNSSFVFASYFNLKSSLERETSRSKSLFCSFVYFKCIRFRDIQTKLCFKYSLITWN